MDLARFSDDLIGSTPANSVAVTYGITVDNSGNWSDLTLYGLGTGAVLVGGNPNPAGRNPMPGNALNAFDFYAYLEVEFGIELSGGLYVKSAN